MKLGISYNLFDGEELLEGSIKQIRSEVDFISVVYQTTSNFGQKCTEELVPLLHRLKSEGLIDFLHENIPTLNVHPHQNEILKRNMGLELSKNNECTHHMSMDCDEYYLIDQFKFLKKEILDGDYDASYCQMLTYYKSWEYILDPPEDYYVSLIYKIKPNEYFGYGKNSPVTTDPTRQIMADKHRIFKRNEIQMHHGSYIRNNIRRKVENSSCKNVNWNIDLIEKHHQNFKDGDKGLIFQNQTQNYFDLKKIKKLF